MEIIPKQSIPSQISQGQSYCDIYQYVRERSKTEKKDEYGMALFKREEKFSIKIWQEPKPVIDFLYNNFHSFAIGLNMDKWYIVYFIDRAFHYSLRPEIQEIVRKSCETFVQCV